MSARPIDSMSMALERLQAAMEEFRAALVEILEHDLDSSAAPAADGPHEREAQG